MVLVSLLVDQLFSLFLIFLGRPKKNLSSLRSFLFTLLNFLSSLFQKMRNWPDNWSAKRLTKTTFSKKTGQKIQESEQKRSDTGQIFVWSTKKMRNRPDNWLTKRLTKSTWTLLRTFVDKAMVKFYCCLLFLSHSFLEPMHLCIRNFGCHNVLICLNYLVQGIVEITYFRKYGNGLLWSYVEFYKVKVYNTRSQCVYTFFFFLDKYTFAITYIHTYVPHLFGL